MKMLDLQNSLLKYKAPLALFVACCILLCNLVIGVAQTHTAETYIKFLGENAAEGLTPDGENPLNPYELTNAAVIASAMDKVGEESDTNLEIVKNLTIIPVIPYAEQEKYSSWIDQFDNYEEDSEDEKAFDVYYKVSFTSKKGPNHARKMLKAILEEYKTFYVDKYGYESDVIELSDKATLGYDYFESARIIEEKIESDIKYFESMEGSDAKYRSPATGYTASDVISMYTNLRDTALASVYNKILTEGIARDNETLAANLSYDADEAGMDRDRNIEKADTQIELMKIYSEKNKNYLWDERYANDESEQVREDTERDYTYTREKSVYDAMMLDYTGFMTEAVNANIDEKYNNEYAKRFVNTADVVDESVQTALEDVCSKLNTIHEIAEKTISDYNHYKSAKFIQLVTGISVTETMGEMIYYAATLVLSLGLGVVVIIFTELKKKGTI